MSHPAAPLNTAWTQHLSGDAKTDFEKLVRNTTLVLTRLKAIIEEKENALTAPSFSQSDFKDPNWSHKQAFRNGALSELSKLKAIIPI